MKMKSFLGLITICLLSTAFGDDKLDTVKLSPDLKEQFVKIGDPFFVTCSVSAKSPSKIVWEQPAPKDSRTKLIASEERDGGAMVKRLTSTLKIASITAKDLGDYKCTFGASSATIKIMSPTEIKTEGRNYTYGDTNPVTLSCNLGGQAVEGKVIESVKWLKNDTLVSELTDHNRFSENPDNNTLTISDPTREDADLYIARFSFKDVGDHYDCEVPFTAFPLVLDFDKSKNLIEDDNMELQCKVKGYPRPPVEWLKNKKVLNVTDSDRVTQSTLNGFENAKLVIKSVQFEDAGDYTCRVHSASFNLTDEKTLTVRVKDKLAALWPFLGIVGEVIVLCTIIFIYEKRRNKQAESEANNAQDVDGSTTDKKEGLRHRNTQSNNPTA